MNASWKPQVKKPSTSSTYERCPSASVSACLSDCGATAPAGRSAAAGVTSASDSGRIRSITTLKMVSAACQPRWSESTTAKGEYRNCPNEPAAVPAPKASERQLAGKSLPNPASTIVKEQPESPKPMSTPAERSSMPGVDACAIRYKPSA